MQQAALEYEDPNAVLCNDNISLNQNQIGGAANNEPGTATITGQVTGAGNKALKVVLHNTDGSLAAFTWTDNTGAWSLNALQGVFREKTLSLPCSYW